MYPMTWKDRLAMTACYLLVATLGWMVLHPQQFTGFVMGLLP